MFGISPHDWDIAARLLVAMVLGALIGLERESQGKDAGVRTYALVSLGSALIMIISTEIFEMYRGKATVDPSRIAAQVVSGVGFLGAGAILRFEKGIKGLTTAAGIWAVAGIGLACGVGLYFPAIISTVFILSILLIWSKVDHFFGGKDH